VTDRIRMTDAELFEAAARGAQARVLLDSPLFKEAAGKLERRLITTWRSATTLDEREQIHARLSALTTIIADIRQYFDDGEAASAMLAKRSDGTASTKGSA